MEHPHLFVRVSETFSLDAGWHEETQEETTSGTMLSCRLIHAPEPTMYEQLLHHLELSAHNITPIPKSQLHFGEVALATIAVCLRWGTYFAVLADRTKPLWSETSNEEISMICDDEMARINIEASAALTHWIELMRADDKHFRKIVKAALQLPMIPSQLDDKTNYKLYRLISFINSASSRQNFINTLKKQFGEEWLEQERANIMPHPVRWLANGLINAYWRNKSGIEDIHAGQWSARPLLQRRITPYQEYELVREIAEGFVPNMHAIYNVINKKSDDGWEARIFSLAINFHPPYDWSLIEQTRDVLLEGAEPELHSNKV
jgi:hypothetical protein